ncbi:MAG TPA: DUF444 family protein [Myxococcota bacterium]|nr:DUF444 family protein [Myxococcota bacterium]
MSLSIKQDHSRFRQIVRGKIKQNLRRYITKGELLGKEGKDVVSIPVPQIDIPRFRYGQKQTGGVGQGEGEVGQPLSGGEDGEGSGQGKAGDTEGDHMLEVELSIDELAQILGEELQLPNIEPRGRKNVEAIKNRYNTVRRTGPNSLRHFRHTFRRALKRQLSSGTYDKRNPIIVPVREDVRFRGPRTIVTPEANAVIVYMMDVSGSMGDEQKEIVRIETFWIDTWLRAQYKGLEVRYIIHDAVAREVDRDTFFRTKESGGTMISSAYKLCTKILEDEYPENDWNAYPFHFSDGDNWSVDDTLVCLDLLRGRLIPRSNLFCYGQVESPYGSGQFLKDLVEAFASDEKVLTSEIKDKDAIVDSIKTFLGTGK